jgi:hypothetical protein
VAVAHAQNSAKIGWDAVFEIRAPRARFAAGAPIAQLAEAADLKSAQCRFESDWGHRFCRLSYPSVPYKVVQLRAAGMAPVMQQDVSYLARQPPDHTDKGAGWGAGKKLLVVPPGTEAGEPIGANRTCNPQFAGRSYILLRFSGQ